MKTWEVQNAFGIDSLKLVDKAEPKPGPGQVLVKMTAWSLNYRDLMVVKGLYNPKLRFPFTPLSDGVGTVAAVGDGVTRVKVGDRVAGCFLQRWIDGALDDAKGKSALGGGQQGVLAEQVVLHEDGVVHVPPHMSDPEAATLPCAALTAWNALVTSGNLKAGESVLIQGTGGVSLFALQFAKLHGARVIGTSSSNDKLARALGQSLKAVRTGGTVALIGVLSGTGQVNPLPILMRHIRLQGIFVGSRAMFEAMNRAVALHQLRPVVDRVFRFNEAPAALRHLESAAHFGKICIQL